jgi:hypothetical protein
MTFSGNVNTLDPPGAVNKATFKADFLLPVAADIEALQVGSAIAMSGTPWTLDEINAGATTLARINGVTRPLSLLNAYRATAAERPWLTASDLGLAGDGVTDDAPALQRAYETYAALGGAVFMLRAQPGQSFYFKGSPRGGDNISTIFFSPHTVTRYAGLKLGGSLASDAGSSGIRLSSNATAGDTALALDLSTVGDNGGDVVSSLLSVNDSIRITGLRDSCGTSRQSQELRVTAIDDGASTITVTPALNFAYEIAYAAGDYEEAQGSANVTLISKLITVQASADIAANSNLWTINAGDVGKLVEGDWVLVSTENRAGDVAGTSTQLTHSQITRIAAGVTGDAVDTLRLIHNLPRAYTTAKFARLIKINPILNAAIQGGTVEFTEAPGDVTTPSFEVAYGVDCVLSGCNVPNTDVYGTRGEAFRLYRSFSSGIENCIARRTRYYAGGEGYGIYFGQSTNCWSRGGSLDAMRHGVIFQGSTNCTATDPYIDYPRQAPIDFHGANEYGCRVVNATVTASTSHENIAGISPIGMAFGNTFHLAGSHKCGVIGGRWSGFKGAEGTHKSLIDFRVPSTDCYVRATEFNDIGSLFVFNDLIDFGALVTSGHRIDGVSVDGCAGYLMYIDTRANGAVIDTLTDLAITDCSFTNINKTITAKYVTKLQIYECEVDGVTVDPDHTYFIDGQNCTDFNFNNNNLNGCGRGLKLIDCTNFRVYDNISANQTFSTIFRDDGGNTGYWHNNQTPGQTGSATRSGASVIVEGPRAAGSVVMADDTFFAFKPERLQGSVQVFTNGASTVFGLARFTAVGTADCDLYGSVSTANVEVTTGVLDGTTGTDTKFTISAANTGIIYLENRTGSSVTIDFSTF